AAAGRQIDPVVGEQREVQGEGCALGEGAAAQGRPVGPGGGVAGVVVHRPAGAALNGVEGDGAADEVEAAEEPEDAAAPARVAAAAADGAAEARAAKAAVAADGLVAGHRRAAHGETGAVDVDAAARSQPTATAAQAETHVAAAVAPPGDIVGDPGVLD